MKTIDPRAAKTRARGRLLPFNQCTIGVARKWPPPWEMHPTGDELLHMLEGEVEVGCSRRAAGEVHDRARRLRGGGRQPEPGHRASARRRHPQTRGSTRSSIRSSSVERVGMSPAFAAFAASSEYSASLE